MTSLHTQTLSKKLDCCVCASPKAKQTHFKKVDSYQLIKCDQCHLIYLEQVHVDPVQFLDEVTEKDESSSLEYWGYPEVFSKHASVFHFYFEERLERILATKPPQGKWLDIGSGYGLWQTFLREKNIENQGIEIEVKAQRFCVKQGLEVELASIEDWKNNGKFSVITLCDVLEHVTDPAYVLRKCYDLLSPGGVIYIQVPWVVGLRYPYNDSLGLPHHLWQFNQSALNSLAESCGLKAVESWTGIQGVIRHYENGGPSWWRKSLWKLSSFSKRGNRLQLLARKS